MRNVLVLFLLIIAGYYFYKFLKRENFISAIPSSAPAVKFMTKEETTAFILSDPDSYVKSFSQWDLIARGVKSQDEYMKNSADSAVDFTENQRGRFSKAAGKADDFFRKLGLYSGIDCNEIAKIPWKLALTTQNVYEDGLPHTRGDIIFVATSLNELEETLVTTLIHEKVHLYQRMNPDAMQKWLNSEGYLPLKYRIGIPQIRANPDLDNYIYINPLTKKEMGAYYSTDEPHNITDVYYTDASNEHPYEILAYEIADSYKQP